MNKIAAILLRNRIDYNGKRFDSNTVHLEWWQRKENVGDYIASVVYDWMTRDIDLSRPKRKGIHLTTVGSLLGGGNYDATVWGSGMLDLFDVRTVYKKAWLRKFDVRAVRGPLTREVLMNAGYNCADAALGDPAVLMPLIYQSPCAEKKYGRCIVNHYINAENLHAFPDSVCISAGTNDYKKFIDTLKASGIVISSSLHGVILAEAYGIPAIYCCENLEKTLFKVYDYYFSTGRYNVIVARSVEEAMTMQPMPLPDLSDMQQALISAFPRDLWE